MNNLHDEDILRNFAESNESFNDAKTTKVNKETKTEQKKSTGKDENTKKRLL